MNREFNQPRWLFVVSAVMAIAATSPLKSQVSTTRARGDTIDSVAPCDSLSTPTGEWPEIYAGGLAMRFTMRVPPEAFEVLQQSSGALSYAAYRAGRGDRSLTYIMQWAGAGGTVGSGPQLSVARRCYREVGPHVIQYWATRVGEVYVAGALWTWRGHSRGRSLLMHATGPDSLWQGRALAAMRTVAVDTLEWKPGSSSRP